MNDNSEQVVLEIDESQVIQGTAKANAALDAYGKKAVQSIGEAGKAFENHGGLVVRTSDRTRTSVERLVSSSEKLAATYGKSGVEKLVAQRDQLIQRLGNEEKAVERVRASYEKMIKATEHGKGEHGNPFEHFGEKIKEFVEDPIGSAKTAIGGLLTSMGPLGAAVAGGAAIFGTIAVAAFEAAKSLGEYAINIERVKLRTGLTNREVSQFGIAAKLVGMDISAFEHSMRGLTAAMTDESEAGIKARNAMHDMGVIPRELNGELKASGPLFMELSEALNKLPTMWEQNKVGMEIFKKAWIENGPAILKLAEGVKMAAAAGFSGSSQADLDKFMERLEHIEIAEAKWDRFWRGMKAGLVDYLEFAGKHGNIIPWFAPDGGAAPPQDNSWAARQEALAIAKERAGGNSVLNAARSRMAGTPEGLTTQVSAAKTKYEEASRNLQTLSDIGPEAAKREVAKVEALRVAYEGLNQRVEAGKKLKEQTLAFDREASAFEKRNSEAELNAVEKIYFERDRLLALATKNTSAASIAALRLSTDEAVLTERVKEHVKALNEKLKADQALDKLVAEHVIHLNEELTLEREKDATAVYKNRRALQDAGAQEQERQDRDAGQRQIRSIEAGALPGSERITAARVEQLRIAMAQGEAARGRARIHDEEVEAGNLPGRTGDERRQQAEQLNRLKIEGVKLEGELQRQIDDAHDDAVHKTIELQKREFEEIKGKTEGLLHTLFTDPKNFGGQLKTTLRDTLLHPIEDKLSTMIAGPLQNLFGSKRGIDQVQLVNGAVPVVVMGAGGDGGGGSASGGFSSAAGTFSRLARMGLSLPVAAAMAMGSPSHGGEVIGGGDSTAGLTQLSSGLWSRGPGAGLGDLASIAGIGGTGGFSGGYGGPGGARGNPLSGILGMLKGGFKGINWGGLTRGDAGGLPGVDGQPGTDLGNTGKITGVNGLAGTALTAGGMMLAQQGLLGSSRGTWAGVGMGALGGAMAGFAMGGPIGAAIGGGVGLLIGLGEKIAGVETPEREAARLIKSIYGLNIASGSTTIQQIVGMAKQNYGGSVSMAVRSAPVRELLQLYADNTGQKSSALLAQQVHSASLTQSGGSLYQSATYQNGTPYTYASNLPTLGPSGGALPTSNSMSGPVIVQVSPEATQNLWATGTAMAIAGNPRGVAQANVNGSGQSAARLNNANLQFSPSTITS